jgi:catechol 2,3-dioxygenase-like lactoylglutathione lyase family enzyme
MTSTLSEVLIDCADAERLARFWCDVLGWEILDRDDEDVEIGDPNGTLRLVFLPVPEPKTVKNRVHIDVHANDGDQAAEVERLIGLGATHADVGQAGDESWVVLADPEGNEFCVLAGPPPR